MSTQKFSFRGLPRPHSPQRRPGKTLHKIRKIMRLRRLMRFQWAMRKIWAANRLWQRLEMRKGLDSQLP